LSILVLVRVPTGEAAGRLREIAQGEGWSVVPNTLGRKRLAISVTKVYDELRNSRNVSGAARKLGCSPAYIYQVLRDDGKTAAEVLRKSEQRE